MWEKVLNVEDHHSKANAYSFLHQEEVYTGVLTLD